MSRSQLIRVAFTRYILGLIVLGAIFFLTAGTFAYWQAWVYLAILFGAMFFVGLWLLRNDPELLERRMRTNERKGTQSRVVGLSFIWFALAFILPGLDIRFGWSNVPVIVVVAAEALVLLGYLVVFWVFRTNSYAGRTVVVDEGQKVIDSGPYALVRHPMYIGSIILYVFSPLALGSWWAMIPALPIIPILIVRLLDEEKVLRQDLVGYSDYCGKVRYRLLPGVW